MMPSLEIYTDAACRKKDNRPTGPTVSGFIIVENDQVICSSSEPIGDTTSNVGEYTAVINALDAACGISRGVIKVFSDSELVVNHLNGKYRLRASNLKPLFDRIKLLSSRFTSVTFIHVPRENERIQEVDHLCNQALDKVMGKNKN